MAQGVFEAFNELIGSILKVFQNLFNTAYSLVYSAFHTVYSVIHHALSVVASTVGMSIHLVTANLSLLVVGLAVWFLATRTATGQRAASNAQAKAQAGKKKIK